MEFHSLTPDMLPLCHALCADSIAALPDDAYPLAARLAWAGIWDDETASAWAARLSASWSVAVSAGGELLGFAWLMTEGEFDMLYVTPAAQRRGLAMQMIRQLEETAAKAGLVALHAWASHAARPVFELAGYAVLRANAATRDGVTLENWLMAKGGWQEPASTRRES
jgi:putative acetyltransferase